MRNVYAFDLDGTVTDEETLPALAGALGLSEEMGILTRLTMEGHITFRQSFRLRYHILKSVHPGVIRDIMETVRLNPVIISFIHENLENCCVVTGNLDTWVSSLAEKIGCRFFASRSVTDEAGNIVLDEILDKGMAIRGLRDEGARIIAIGDGFNDIPMFEAADVAVAYSGVHIPVRRVTEAADYVVRNAEELCRLLKSL